MVVLISCFNVALAAPSRHWVGVWMAAMIPSPTPVGSLWPRKGGGQSLRDQTLRQMVYMGSGGKRLRVRISNKFGTKPLKLTEVSIGLQAEGKSKGELIKTTIRPLNFHGRSSVAIPPGAMYYSDPVDLKVNVGQMLGVSIYVSGKESLTTWHPDARQTNYISVEGNYVRSPSIPIRKTIGSYYWLSGISVEATQASFAIVALGDSITNGYRSTTGGNHTYPDELVRRLNKKLSEAGASACQRTVLNAGIDGNQVSAFTGSYGYGPSMVSRFNRDVLSQSGVRYVVLLGGINDIGEPAMAAKKHDQILTDKLTAGRIIDGLRQIIMQAHNSGLKIYGATLLPFKGASGPYSKQGEKARIQVNSWIKHQANFDGVIDFDAATQDPGHPLRLRPDLDSGDHLHPNDEGYKAMAAVIPLRLFGCH